MKNNIICIDLDKFSEKYGVYPALDIEKFKVPTPCTLTDAVEQFDLTIKCLDIRLSTKEDVELFKKKYLLIKDYEEGAFYVCDGYYHIFKEGKFFVGSNVEGKDITAFNKIRKA